MFKAISDLIKHKDLIWHMTISDFKTGTARTNLGFLWWIFDPILYMGIFYLLVQVILQRGGPDYAVNLFVGLIPLKWATAALVSSTNTLSSKSHIIKQIYVPKVIFIFVSLFVNTLKFGISSIVLFLFLWLYGIEFTEKYIYFFIIVIINAIFLYGVMLILAHVGIFIRDIRNAMQYIARILMYVSPVLFSIETVPKEVVGYLYLNPLTTIIVSYKNVLLRGLDPEWFNLSILLIVSIILIGIGTKIIYKYEKEYAKVI
ncbi:ABC transporter permease [Metabacillus halosaccharovorans]|uniref:ABC transporter permease n=1 Tax=Metabacillus halosaccharovorans TaxID=930124 RepID=UPI0020426A09|nr:ABC transporter permease [Metabacillus halosaccharovorans]MCM3443791.1 ABC transporter permease [Metabacillus halosaccharovorans]